MRISRDRRARPAAIEIEAQAKAQLLQGELPPILAGIPAPQPGVH